MTRTRRLLAVLVTLAVAASAPLTAAPAPAAPSTPPATAPDRAAPVAVKVVQYNVRFGAKGLDGVAADIAATGAQVVLLNEVDDRTRRGGVHQARYLARRLGMRWVYDGASRVPVGRRGNAILTSHALGRPVRHRLPGPGGRYQRGLMGAVVDTGAVRLTVWTTHLHYGAGRLAQARAVRERIGDPRCATVLGGDLNTVPRSREHRVVTTHLHDLWQRKGTGPGYTNARNTARIDYLLHDGIKPVGARVTALRHSDHRAVVGRFAVDPARSC